jgi:hypothetical protein
MRGLDLRKEIGAVLKEKGVIQKAPVSSTTGGTYTNYGLFPAFPLAEVVDRTVRETPLVRLLRRVANRGPTHVYNILTAKQLGNFTTEDAAISDFSHTRTLATASMKILVAEGRVTDFAQAASSSYNPMQNELAVANDALAQALENEIINGDTSVDALGFNGLLASITTNAANNSNTNVTLAQMRTDMGNSFITGTSGVGTGLIDLVVTDVFTHNYIKGLLMDFQRNIEKPAANMDFGIPDAFMFDGALVIRDRFMPSTAASRQLVYLDTRYVYLAVLRDVTYDEMAKTNLSKKFVLSWFGSLIVSFEAACARRYGLA